MPATVRTVTLLLSLMSLSLPLSGCGQSQSAAPPPPAVRGIFTTAADCAGLGTLTLEQCSEVLDAAVSAHEASAPIYPNLKACEAEEGEEKCERTHAKTYRPRLLAFMVAMSTPPTAAPLYPTKKGEAGFRTPDSTVLLSDDETLTLSLQARAAAAIYTGKANGGGGLGF